MGRNLAIYPGTQIEKDGGSSGGRVEERSEKHARGTRTKRRVKEQPAFEFWP